MRSSIWLAIAFAAQLGGCGAWTVTATEPVGYVDITTAPVADIDVYPSTVYDGRTVYLYNDRWYYREGTHWRYFQHEPPVLYQHRQQMYGQLYVDVPAPPVPNIDVYPNTIYNGRPTSLYNDRWYYREGPQWRYYRQEPQPLMQQRQRFHAQPPPSRAPYGEPYRHEQPPPPPQGPQHYPEEHRR